VGPVENLNKKVFLKNAESIYFMGI
jgi:hypothetical protein